MAIWILELAITSMMKGGGRREQHRTVIRLASGISSHLQLYVYLHSADLIPRGQSPASDTLANSSVNYFNIGGKKFDKSKTSYMDYNEITHTQQEYS